MNRFAVLFLFVTTLAAATFGVCQSPRATMAEDASAARSTMRDRWFYVSYNLADDSGADNVVNLIERAGKVNLNGMLWSAPWDRADEWSTEEIARFERIKRAAQTSGVEIIPILWSIGYGTMTGRNPNLAEGLLIRDLPLVARDGRASFAPSSDASFVCDMETWKGDNLANLQGFQDRAGTSSFCDREVFHGGSAALRFEKMETDPYGHGRVMWELTLEPERLYRASIWIKVSDLIGRPLLQAYSMSGDQLAAQSLSAKADANGKVAFEWRKAEILFRTPADGKVRVYAGVWDGKSGQIWVDDLAVEPVGLVNPLQRPGAPITVTSEDAATIYERGKDWELPEFRVAPWKTDAPSLSLVIPDGSRISDGESLRVDYYYPPLVGAPQIGTCMSEPEVYEYFEKSAAAVVKLLNPQKWFLSMDEIRCANTCEACHARGESLAEILADCITKQRAIIKNVRPDAEIYIWSDMLDPNHNAHANYYVCEGDYSGVWDLIPKDLIISCWWYEMREKSMEFFSSHGFKTQGAAYYDTDNLDGCADWLELCARTPNCLGIMYTTWQRKYDLLEGFGKLVDPSNVQASATTPAP